MLSVLIEKINVLDQYKITVKVKKKKEKKRPISDVLLQITKKINLPTKEKYFKK